MRLHSLCASPAATDSDPSFALGNGITSSGYLSYPDAVFYRDYPGRVSGLALQPDGKVIVVGNFVYVDGTFAPGIVRLTTDGAPDSEFRLGGTDSFAVPEPTFVPPVVGGPALALMPDGDVLTTMIHYVSVTKTEPVSYSGIVRLNGDPANKCKK